MYNVPETGYCSRGCLFLSSTFVIVRREETIEILKLKLFV